MCTSQVNKKVTWHGFQALTNRRDRWDVKTDMMLAVEINDWYMSVISCSASDVHWRLIAGGRLWAVRYIRVLLLLLLLLRKINCCWSHRVAMKSSMIYSTFLLLLATQLQQPSDKERCEKRRLITASVAHYALLMYVTRVILMDVARHWLGGRGLQPSQTQC